MNKAADIPSPVALVGSPGEAELLIRHLGEVMDSLLAVVGEETHLVRAGRMRDARQLEATKTDLSRLYVNGTTRLRANQSYMKQVIPETLRELRRQHDVFQAVLQMNLTVLATAHAVSEGIMRGVAEELARKAAPSVYGASGRQAAVPKSAAQPLTLSRVL